MCQDWLEEEVEAKKEKTEREGCERKTKEPKREEREILQLGSAQPRLLIATISTCDRSELLPFIGLVHHS